VQPGLINLDFADVKAVMSGQGAALMGSASGAAISARRSARDAVASPCWRRRSTGRAASSSTSLVGPTSPCTRSTRRRRSSCLRRQGRHIIFGTVIDEKNVGQVKITVVQPASSSGRDQPEIEGAYNRAGAGRKTSRSTRLPTVEPRHPVFSRSPLTCARVPPSHPYASSLRS